MKELENQKKYYDAVAYALEHCVMSGKIKEISNNETLDFEISGIAQLLDENKTEVEISAIISKYLNQSFDGQFQESEFLDAAKTILNK